MTVMMLVMNLLLNIVTLLPVNASIVVCKPDLFYVKILFLLTMKIFSAGMVAAAMM